jgi:alkaline phosphatase
MFDTNTTSSKTSRRDWMKALSLGGAAAMLPSCQKPEAKQAGAPVKSDRVRGIVFMVSDGMSPGVLTMAQAFSQQTRQRGTHWWDLINQRSSARGLMDTASANSMVTDSAAASSAWGGGQRVKNGMINFTLDGKEITPIAALLKKKDVRIGFVTTASVTHATPAGFAAAVKARNDENSVAQQYLNRVDVILGGGAQFFDPQRRSDRKDLFAEYRSAGYQVIKNRSELLESKSEKLLGTFAPNYLPYMIDRAQSAEMQAQIPDLAEMADAALTRFLSSGKTFLLQVEGARIDHAAHLNDIGALLRDQLAFDDAVGKVLERCAAHPDILVVVTSDHGNANPGLNGLGSSYGESTRSFETIARMKQSHEVLLARWRQNPQVNLNQQIKDSLGFALQPDEAQCLEAVLTRKPIVEWNDQLENPEGQLGQFAGNHTGVGWTGTTHTSDPTIVTATGPQAERFSGMVVNTDVFVHLHELLG